PPAVTSSPTPTGPMQLADLQPTGATSQSCEPDGSPVNNTDPSRLSGQNTSGANSVQATHAARDERPRHALVRKQGRVLTRRKLEARSTRRTVRDRAAAPQN